MHFICFRFKFGLSVPTFENITNKGILPLELGKAKLEIGTHIMFHEFPLHLLKAEKAKLDSQIDQTLTQMLPMNLKRSNHLEILTQIKEACEDKLKYFSFYSRRQRRGALNFIGTGFNWLFGTLDNNDKEIYDKAILELNKNEFKIQEKYDSLWSMNIAAMHEINNTLHNAFVNDNILQNEIGKLNQTVVMHELEEDISLYITKYQIILRTINELMDSLTFCKHHTLDPVIISPESYLTQLQNLDNNHVDLPYQPTADNIFLYQEITTVNCAFNTDHILYFLHLPLFTRQAFKVYKLVPVPMNVQSQYYRPRVSPDFVIRHDDTVLTTPNCLKATHNSFLCMENFQAAPTCEFEALTRHDVSTCHLDSLALEADFVEIDENEHVIMFNPRNTTIAYQCTSSANHYFSFTGVFLVNPNNCSLTINSKVIRPRTPSTTRLFIPDIQMNPIEILHSHDLRSLWIRQDTHQYTPDNVSSTHLQSFTWEHLIILILLILILFICIFFIVKHNFCTFIFRLIPQQPSAHPHTSEETKNLNDNFIELTQPVPTSFASDIYPRVPDPIPLPRT